MMACELKALERLGGLVAFVNVLAYEVEDVVWKGYESETRLKLHHYFHACVM